MSLDAALRVLYPAGGVARVVPRTRDERIAELQRSLDGVRRVLFDAASGPSERYDAAFTAYFAAQDLLGMLQTEVVNHE